MSQKNAQNEEGYKHLQRIQFIERQKRLTAQRKNRKKAVLIIEKYMYKKTIRKKYRELRERLKQVPPEMRIVYFKYMALRNETN